MKQWEGVEANGLPTPTFNFIKRVVGFTVATITSDNIKVTATALANTPGTNNMSDMVNSVNDEFEAIVERNNIPSLIREFARNAAVDGDGCMYTYWDDTMETGQEAKGGIVTELMDNTRVFFGNPNDRCVQTQPWIIIEKREILRNVRKKAKENGFSNWQSIGTDAVFNDTDSAKQTDDKVIDLTLLWRNEEDGEIWAYEFTRTCGVRKPWSLGIKLYPINWLNWDFVKDCYHGQAMVTGLIPNQVFVNKSWAMTQLSIMKTAFSKVVYDATRLKRWDNRVGSAIGIQGDVNTVAKIIDPAPISPQVSQLIQLAVQQTEESLGATSVALGDTRPDNTSAIIALQRAASTPSEMTKQNLYKSTEDLFRIYLEFMAEYYGTRYVDVSPRPDMIQAAAFAMMPAPESVLAPFDFKTLKYHPMTLKLDVGASTYYSEIASMQTLDRLLELNVITPVQYLERISDDYVPQRRALIAEKKQEQMPMAQLPPVQKDGEVEGGDILPLGKMDIPTGRGFGELQRKINNTGDTAGLI